MLSRLQDSMNCEIRIYRKTQDKTQHENPLSSKSYHTNHDDTLSIIQIIIYSRGMPHHNEIVGAVDSAADSHPDLKDTYESLVLVYLYFLVFKTQ
jgi:hypothetical protein